MGYKKENATVVEPFSWPKYSEAQLDDFERSLKKFVREKVIVWKGEKKTIHPIKVEDAMVEFGAMSKLVENGIETYAVIVEVMETDSRGNATRYKYPTKYDLFQHKIKALEALKIRRGYAEKKQLEDYQKMSEGLAESKTISSDHENSHGEE